MITTKDFSPNNRTKTIGHSMYRICNTETENGTGKWYIIEVFNNQTDAFATGRSEYYSDLEDVLSIFNGISRENAIIGKTMGVYMQKLPEMKKLEMFYEGYVEKLKETGLDDESARKEADFAFENPACEGSCQICYGLDNCPYTKK